MFHKGGDGNPKGFGFGGFSINRSEGGGSSKKSMPGRTFGYHLNIGRKRINDEDEYVNCCFLEYQYLFGHKIAVSPYKTNPNNLELSYKLRLFPSKQPQKSRLGYSVSKTKKKKSRTVLYA